jgi:hypothetical protein
MRLHLQISLIRSREGDVNALYDDPFGHVYPEFEEYLEGHLSLRGASNIIARRMIQCEGDPNLPWTFILEMATACPEQHDKLHEFLVHLSQLSDPVGPDKMPVTIYGMLEGSSNTDLAFP